MKLLTYNNEKLPVARKVEGMQVVKSLSGGYSLQVISNGQEFEVYANTDSDLLTRTMSKILYRFNNKQDIVDVTACVSEVLEEIEGLSKK